MPYVLEVIKAEEEDAANTINCDQVFVKRLKPQIFQVETHYFRIIDTCNLVLLSCTI